MTFRALLLLACSLGNASLHAVTLPEFAAEEWRAGQAPGGAVAGVEGWLFLRTELRFLAAWPFWGPEARLTTRAVKPELGDPLPAIIDFHQQLKARGIFLVLVPVPPKAALLPQKLSPQITNTAAEAMAPLRQFYTELRQAGVEVVDLSETWATADSLPGEKGAPFCRTDTHWSGTGCASAAQAIAAKVRPHLPKPPATSPFRATWGDATITGDLLSMQAPGTGNRDPETLRLRTVTWEANGTGVEVDAASPLLLLGDSHVLVYHDFLAEHAGLHDQLAAELGLAPDVLGTRGSGATPVRISLYRKSLKDPSYLLRKKVIVWCFAAREFTECVEGWPKLPVAK